MLMQAFPDWRPDDLCILRTMSRDLTRCLSTNCEHFDECKHGQLQIRTMEHLPNSEERFRWGARTIHPVSCHCQRWKD